MRALINTLRFIVRHPLNRGRALRALGRFARWQVGSRLVPGAVAVPFVGETRLLVTPGMTGATGNIYCGLHEFEDMGFVLHALCPGDRFLDVGANVGSYTVLAAGACRAEVLAVEPHPQTCARLLANVRLNRLESQVRIENAAVGAVSGRVAISSDLDTTNHVLSDLQRAAGIEVPMTTLDELAGDWCPFVMKIDVEGFESEVLRGGAAVLRAPSLQAVVMELNGSGSKYGFDETALHTQVLDSGFTPCSYDPFERALVALPSSHKNTAGNTLYVRDLELVRARVRGAPRYRVLDREL